MYIGVDVNIFYLLIVLVLLVILGYLIAPKEK